MAAAGRCLLRAGAVAAGDLWRETSYGVHDDGRALLSPFPDDSAVEAGFLLDVTQRFDQAGALVRAGSATGSRREWRSATVCRRSAP